MSQHKTELERLTRVVQDFSILTDLELGDYPEILSDKLVRAILRALSEPSEAAKQAGHRATLAAMAINPHPERNPRERNGELFYAAVIKHILEEGESE